LAGVFEYSTDIFTEEDIQSFAREFNKLLEYLIERPHEPLSGFTPEVRSPVAGNQDALEPPRVEDLQPAPTTIEDDKNPTGPTKRRFWKSPWR
jgi:hypothetical protein